MLCSSSYLRMYMSSSYFLPMLLAEPVVSLVLKSQTTSTGTTFIIDGPSMSLSSSIKWDILIENIENGNIIELLDCGLIFRAD